MTVSHEVTDELLAGYVLRSLSGTNAEEADRLLIEHVPGCSVCRVTLDAFGGATAALALAIDPVKPPETLLPRLHREIGVRGRRAGRGRFPRRLVTVAAGVVLVVGLGGAAVSQFGGGSNSTLSQADLQSVISMLTNGGHATNLGQGQAKEITAPGVQELYIWGDDVPLAPSGRVYRVWALLGTHAEYLGEFAPRADGSLALRVGIDPATIDRLLVTEEPSGSQPSTPGDPAWQMSG
jgi:hypothetical protein